MKLALVIFALAHAAAFAPPLTALQRPIARGAACAQLDTLRRAAVVRCEEGAEGEEEQGGENEVEEETKMFSAISLQDPVFLVLIGLMGYTLFGQSS